MTNYEWIVKNKDKLVKGILASSLGKEKGKCNFCAKINCADCDFKKKPHNTDSCTNNSIKWLEAEHESLYKKGDILIIENKDIVIVTKEDDANSVIVSHNIGCAERGEGWRAPFDLIKRKVGNIYD